MNDYHEDGEAFDSDRRKGFERLLRALLRLPAAPAVALLHHYAWPRAGAPPGGLYYASAEADLTVFGQVGWVGEAWHCWAGRRSR